VDRAMVRRQAAIQGLVIPLAATSRCPVSSMKSLSTVLHRVVAAAVVVRATAPAMGVVAHRTVAQVARVTRVTRVMETQHQAPPTGKSHQIQTQMGVRQAAHARKVA
jgi:hypothetical protein